MMRMLIVEDDPVQAMHLADLLREQGDAHICASGEDGLIALCEALDAGRPYQAVFLDIVLPGLDGHQVLERLRALEGDREIPASRRAEVIMVSSLDDMRNISRAFFRGEALAYLAKPVTPEQLERELARLRQG